MAARLAVPSLAWTLSTLAQVGGGRPPVTWRTAVSKATRNWAAFGFVSAMASPVTVHANTCDGVNHAVQARRDRRVVYTGPAPLPPPVSRPAYQEPFHAR